MWHTLLQLELQYEQIASLEDLAHVRRELSAIGEGPDVVLPVPIVIVHSPNGI